MPNLKSAVKQLKKSRKKYSENKAVRSELKTRIKNYRGLIEEKKFPQAEEYLRDLEKILMQSASKNIIHKNKASRHASRLRLLLNKAKD